MVTRRQPFQGVWNIIRFNWHFYVLAFGVMIILCAFGWWMLACLILAVMLISLGTSYYVYDLSNVYQLPWVSSPASARILNIHAGFDETSGILAVKFPSAVMHVYDFYDPVKHTEVSIKRARRVYPPWPGTLPIKTDHIPVQDQVADRVILTLAAHEIRNTDERIRFFKEVHRTLKDGGLIYVTEHLRDIPNFLAYNIGFLHFHSRRTWLQTFDGAGLRILQESPSTPFITTFILSADGGPA
jgi:SAM-dependent methyltransferase